MNCYLMETKMKKIQSLLLLRLIQGIFFLKIVTGEVMAVESDFFDQKDESFWVIKNKESFRQASIDLIDDEGNWKVKPPVPQYIKYVEQLTSEDLPYLERWLSLKGLDCFAIADTAEQPNLSLIYSWYSELREQEENLKNKNLHKLAWLDYKTTYNELQRGTSSILPEAWVETDRDYQMKNSHYRVLKTH